MELETDERSRSSATPLEIEVRPARPADSELLLLWRNEPSVRQYQPLGFASPSQLRAELASQTITDLYRAQGDKFQWIIESVSQPAGWITLVVTNWDHGLAELGYALSTPYQRLGIMPLALHHLLADLFSHTQIERIEARCAVDNIGSSRVLEKIGFTREGRLRDYFRLRGERVDNFLYAILRRDFLPRMQG